MKKAIVKLLAEVKPHFINGPGKSFIRYEIENF